MKHGDALRFGPMPGLDQEVIDVLSRLAGGQISVKGRDKRELYKLAEVLINFRVPLAEVLAELNNQGDTFAEIGKTLGIHEATAGRYAKPPTEDLRRRRRGKRSPDHLTG